MNKEIYVLQICVEHEDCYVVYCTDNIWLLRTYVKKHPLKYPESESWWVDKFILNE